MTLALVPGNETIFQDEKEEEDNGRGITVWDGTAGTADFGPHGDAESRAFYEDLPDLLGLVPLSALGLTPEQVRACVRGCLFAP